jgi:hypothetical protein
LTAVLGSFATPKPQLFATCAALAEGATFEVGAYLEKNGGIRVDHYESNEGFPHFFRSTKLFFWLTLQAFDFGVT